MANILIIEDDRDIREGIRILLESEGYCVSEAGDGTAGLSLLSKETDLVVLDIMLPGMSGIQICEIIRKTYNVPILFLTARVQESDKLLGLMVGGDDYLTKPFSYAELVGRVKALLRRYQVYSGKNTASGESEDEYIESGNIRIHTGFNEVFVNGKPAELSNLEYKMLLLFVRHPRKVFSAQNLYESVWEEPYFYSCNGTVMVHISKLRTKIEETPQKPKRIITVWGRGYRFESNPN